VEREEAEFRAANERKATMAEELRKAELVRDRLEGLAQPTTGQEGEGQRAPPVGGHLGPSAQSQDPQREGPGPGGH
jgi:hypothetical protein